MTPVVDAAGEVDMSSKHILFKLIVFVLGLSLVLPMVSSGLHAYSSPGEKIPDHWARQLRHHFSRAKKNLFDANTILRAAQKINLSQKQEQKVESIMMQFKEFTIRQSAEIKISELRFASTIKSDKLDKKTMAAHMRAISKQKTDWVVTYINYLLDLREILTAQQREMLKQTPTYNKKRRHPPQKRSGDSTQR